MSEVWCYSVEGDDWEGNCGSRDDAVCEATDRARWCESQSGRPIRRIEVARFEVQPKRLSSLHGAKDIIDAAKEAICELAEDADGPLENASAQALTELDGLLDGWAEKHGLRPYISEAVEGTWERIVLEAPQ